MIWLKRVLTPPLIVLAAILMWVEEFLWKRLKALTSLIALIPIVQRLESHIRRLPPYWAMAAFLLPMATLFPLKVLAVYWLACGYWLASLALIGVAKVLGTAIVARMYVVCHPQLMTIAWFRRLYSLIISVRDWLYDSVRHLPVYIAARRFLLAIKESAKKLFSTSRSRTGMWQRWKAIRRWRRQNPAK